MSLATSEGKAGNGNNETAEEKSYVRFIADKDWLKGDYCISANYLLKSNGQYILHQASMVLKLNKALNMQPSAAGDAASGAH